MMYFNDLENRLKELRSDLLLNPDVKSDLSNVVVEFEDKDGKDYLHLTIKK